MVTDYFFVYSYFSSVRKKNEKNFWDMGIIGNRRKIYIMSKKEAKTQQVYRIKKNLHKLQQLEDFRYRKISQMKTTLTCSYSIGMQRAPNRLDDAYLRPLARKQRLTCGRFRTISGHFFSK